jgi:hypothetical protein
LHACLRVTDKAVRIEWGRDILGLRVFSNGRDERKKPSGGEGPAD